MPLPIIIGITAAVAGTAGLGNGIRGGMKIKKAKNTLKAVQSRNEKNIKHLESTTKSMMKIMDDLGKYEMEILSCFNEFIEVFEKIKNRPEISEIKKDGISIPIFTPEELKKVSAGASILLGGIGGAALGTGGGFAAAGATTAAVMAFGTASTGTAIASLSGVAATNAVLAALGGGAISAGGGGMALGSVILGGATFGIGFLVGGIIFNVAGSKLSNKADKTQKQMKENEEKINKICEYYERLKKTSGDFNKALAKVRNTYEEQFSELKKIIRRRTRFFGWGKVDFNKFKDDEKLITENTVLLVGVLYEMCKINIVQKSKDPDDINMINKHAVYKSIEKADNFLKEKQFIA